MNKYKIKFQLGMNIGVVEIKANNILDAMYLFYMSNSGVSDVYSIQEVGDE